MVNSAAKLIIGLLVFIAGLLWYGADFIGIGKPGLFGASAIAAFKTVFVGLFGIFLIFVGILVVWIEYEDLRWQRREREETRRSKR